MMVVMMLSCQLVILMEFAVLYESLTAIILSTQELHIVIVTHFVRLFCIDVAAFQHFKS
jgi:hypothetical protein